MRTNRRSQRAGFTLVELLVVIVIIGILAGFLLSAVTRSRNRALDASIAMEISNIEKSVEAYKLKYGDYPPNFTDPALVKRHILNVWSHIDAAELSDFLTYTQTNLVDPAEALVFWLDGFSSDPKRPFTGRGGPFIAGSPPTANPERESGVYEFDRARLDYTDDGDLFPVLAPARKVAPYIYFDSRTYSFIQASTPTYTLYTTGSYGVAVPYKSNRPNGAFNALVDPPDQLLEFANPRTFQIISAGRDDNYGTGQSLDFSSLPATYPSSPYGGATLPVFFNYLTKQPFFPHNALPAVDPRVTADFFSGHIDNIANFSDGKKIEDVEE